MPSAQLPPARLPLGDLILLRQARVLQEEFCEQSKQCGLVFDFGRATTTAIATGVATTTSTTALTGCTLADASDASDCVDVNLFSAVSAVAEGYTTTSIVFVFGRNAAGVQVQRASSDADISTENSAGSSNPENSAVSVDNTNGISISYGLLRR